MQASLLSKMKREVQCADGMYQHDKTTCCLCAIGQRLKEHCTAASPKDTQCEQCEPGTYNSQPNQDKSCKRCTSCSHKNAALEVETTCTRGRDTKCRCKANHYCISVGTKGCTTCSPCTECGLEGVRVACNATHDTVCNAKLERRAYVYTGVAVALAIIVVAVFIYRNRKLKHCKQQFSRNSATVEFNREQMEPFNIPQTDPLPYLPAIAEVIGWKTMTRVAYKSGMNHVTIENCELDQQHDSQERTLQLLRIWVEQQGMDAMKTLVQILHDKHKYQAQKVSHILSTRI
ncbi:tumor necrosis factor receptor superfamily member 6 isoform X2 [Corythoichthys intestinalis]|nr:tumor necrosis factor receptor superfamily member 6 isoform X2 [Corythoichthys intestinalis]